MARLPRLPDLLTTANLCCGVVSILLASQGQLTIACWLVFAGAAFDVLDGLAARAFGGGSEFGKQLDSLADMVTFGVAPGVVVYFLPGWLADGIQNGLIINQDAIPWTMRTTLASSYWHVPSWALAIPTFAIAIASAWRLARFNIDDRQTRGFLGLPTPANAIFWASVPFCLTKLLDHANGEPAFLGFRTHLLANPVITGTISIILAFLMLSSIPLPSLKFKHFGWRGNEVIYLLGGIGALLVLLYGILAVPLIMILYVFSPLWGRLFGKVA